MNRDCSRPEDVLGVFNLMSFCGNNEWHRLQGNVEDHGACQRRGMFWLTAAQIVFPALGQQSLPVPLKTCNSTTITRPRYCARILWWQSPEPLFLPCQQDWWIQEDSRVEWYLQKTKQKKMLPRVQLMFFRDGTIKMGEFSWKWKKPKRQKWIWNEYPAAFKRFIIIQSSVRTFQTPTTGCVLLVLNSTYCTFNWFVVAEIKFFWFPNPLTWPGTTRGQKMEISPFKLVFSLVTLQDVHKKAKSNFWWLIWVINLITHG